MEQRKQWKWLRDLGRGTFEMSLGGRRGLQEAEREGGRDRETELPLFAHLHSGGDVGGGG